MTYPYPGDNHVIRCPICGVRAQWVRPYWLCRNLACDRLVVR